MHDFIMNKEKRGKGKKLIGLHGQKYTNCHNGLRNITKFIHDVWFT